MNVTGQETLEIENEAEINDSSQDSDSCESEDSTTSSNESDLYKDHKTAPSNLDQHRGYASNSSRQPTVDHLRSFNGHPHQYNGQSSWYNQWVESVRQQRDYVQYCEYW